MPDPHKDERRRFWRLRAEELRSKASQFEDPIARKGLLEAADGYDRLADAEKAAEAPKGPRKAGGQRQRPKVSRKQRRK